MLRCLAPTLGSGAGAAPKISGSALALGSEPEPLRAGSGAQMALNSSNPAHCETVRLLLPDDTTSSLVSTTPKIKSYGAATAKPRRFNENPTAVRLSWHNINVIHTQTGRKILQNVSGKCWAQTAKRKLLFLAGFEWNVWIFVSGRM
uniref:Secreted protein n=1 Tax=Bursaphelenchus xylophilus TaxID=6326 RepID=A0A1I7SEI0_BURXY